MFVTFQSPEGVSNDNSAKRFNNQYLSFVAQDNPSIILDTSSIASSSLILILVPAVSIASLSAIIM